MDGCASLFLLVFAVGAFVLALTAKQQAERVTRELRDLQSVVDDLRRQLARRPSDGAAYAMETGADEPPVPATPVVYTPDMSREEPASVPLPVTTAAYVSEAPAAPHEPPVRADEPTSSSPPPFEAPPPPPLPAPARSFDWENLVGVKLFSWVAGVALALAAVFFLKYSVDHGWLTPALRAFIGLGTGLGVIAICEMRIARNYRFTANAMDGAGIAILYATLFASHSLWQLAPQSAVFTGMTVVTALAVFLSLQRDSVFIALLGLLGGFATPALLSSGENRPIALFGYLLLLNLGIAWIAYRKRWPVLSVASAIFTVAYQWTWVAEYLTDSQMPLAAGIFAVFAVAGGAALWTQRTSDEIDPTQTIFERIGLATSVVPLFFAAFAAAVPAYGSRFHVLFAFLLLINAGLAAIAVLRRHAWLSTVGGIGSLLTFALWLAFSYAADAWPVIAGWVAAFIVLHLVAGHWLRASTSIAALLLFVFPSVAVLEPAADDATVFFAPFFALFTAVLCFAMKRGRTAAFVVASVLATVAALAWTATRADATNTPALLLVTAAIVLVQLACVLRMRGKTGAIAFFDAAALSLGAHFVLIHVAAAGRLAEIPWPLLAALATIDVAIGITAVLIRRSGFAVAAAVLSHLVLCVWVVQHGELLPAVGLGSALILAFASLGWFFVARTGREFSETAGVPGVGIFGAFVTTLIATHASLLPPRFDYVVTSWSAVVIAALVLAFAARGWGIATGAACSAAVITLLARDLLPGQQLILTVTFAVVFTAFAFATVRRIGSSTHTYIAAAVAHGLLLFAGNASLEELGATRYIGLLPVVQAAVFLALLWHLLRNEASDDRKATRIALLAGVALAFTTVAIPLQFEREWLTLGWALEACALVWLYRRIPHAGLLRWAGALYLVVFARLVFNSAVFTYHPRTGTPVLNWYLYAYLVAAASFFLGSRLLPREWKRSVAALASGGSILLFVLLNIEIADFYSTGRTLAFNFFSATLAEDLTYTVGWALFAIAVLVAGIVINSRGARIAALVLLAVTILKCFLHDLARLGGLYRVGSLLGLAISLVVVGLLIQRFVISREGRDTADAS